MTRGRVEIDSEQWGVGKTRGKEVLGVSILEITHVAVDTVRVPWMVGLEGGAVLAAMTMGGYLFVNILVMRAASIASLGVKVLVAIAAIVAAGSTPCSIVVVTLTAAARARRTLAIGANSSFMLRSKDSIN